MKDLKIAIEELGGHAEPAEPTMEDIFVHYTE